MKMSGPLGQIFAGRRRKADHLDAASLPLTDEQLEHPMLHADADMGWDQANPVAPAATEMLTEKPVEIAHAAALSFDNQSPPFAIEPVRAARPVIGKPHMTAIELALLDRTMKSGFTRYLEFGSGGSTLLAVRSGIDIVVSVESDHDWADTIRHHPEIETRITAGRATILYADIGPTKAFGAPVDSEFRELWPTYIRLPWVEWQRRGSMPDFVFVDGRFRVAACLSVIVAWHLSSRASPFPLLAIHDVTKERRSYQRLFTYFDIIENAESLYLLRLKETIDPVSVFATLLGVQFDPS